MVLGPDYPCLGARAVFNRHRATVRVFDDMGGPGVAADLVTGLTAFARDTDPDAGLASFVAAFRRPRIEDEEQFEQLLWTLLQQVYDADEQPWSREVAADPADPHFSFSVAQTPFFIVGLHPRASREARRAPLPVLVFNLHEQFQELRTSGRFDRMRDTIRRRDIELQGEVNPMVDDYGDSSEARQYSGREVGDSWVAPLTVRADDQQCADEKQ